MTKQQQPIPGGDPLRIIAVMIIYVIAVIIGYLWGREDAAPIYRRFAKLCAAEGYNSGRAAANEALERITEALHDQTERRVEAEAELEHYDQRMTRARVGLERIVADAQRSADRIASETRETVDLERIVADLADLRETAATAGGYAATHPSHPNNSSSSSKD